VGFYYRFFYDTIHGLITQLGIEDLTSSLFKDLITIRILEPASKLRSIELIETYFGIKHRRKNYYKEAPKWTYLKTQALEKVNNFAKEEYGFDYSLIFMMLQHFTLKPLRVMICAKRVLKKTVNRSNHRYSLG
jgi:hypothetical protein